MFSHATFNPDNNYSIHSTLSTIIGELEANKDRIGVVGIIGGHIHVDKYAVSSGGVLVVSTTRDAIPNDSTTRITGTISEQAFDAVNIDLANKLLYMTRIGYGEDRLFSFVENPGIVT